MPGAYTRSKLAAEQRALEAATSEFPVVVASPTMPIGNDRNLTPPASMLQYFMKRRIQFYLDFVINLVDVEDVADGLILAMQRGRSGERYVLGGENITLRKLLATLGNISSRKTILPTANTYPTPIIALAVAGMNDMLNAQSRTQGAWWNRIPTAAWGLMGFIAIACNVLLGYSERRRGALLLLVVPIIVSISVLLIADIDSPRGRIIRVHPHNLIALSQSMKAP
jgi:hypothetical protein